jgi:diacylglycerol kinase family enzyme
MALPKVLVLLNSRSGTLAFSETKDEPARIAAALRRAELDPDVRQIIPPQIPALVGSAAAGGYRAVVVGGGDGTVNAVANAVAGLPDPHRLPMAVLPLGTHNHFSREMNVPDDLDSAIAAIAQAIATGDALQPLDVAEINGTLFLNFSGIGLHPKLVERREVEHKQIKKSALLRRVLQKFTKPVAMAIALLRSLGNLPVMRFVLKLDGQRAVRITPSILIVNNIRQIELFGLEAVSELRRDRLNLYIARTPRLAGMVRLLLSLIVRRLPARREFEARSVESLDVIYRRPTLKVTLDGEVMRLRTPLQYRIRRQAIVAICLPEPASVPQTDPVAESPDLPAARVALAGT